MPKYTEKDVDRRKTDQAMTVFIIIGGSIICLIAVASFAKTIKDMAGPRLRNPWDE
jgi:hypothetical protein